MKTIGTLLTALVVGGCGSAAEEVPPANPAESIIRMNGEALDQVKDLQVGEIVTFGNYEQDGDTSNGAVHLRKVIRYGNIGTINRNGVRQEIQKQYLQEGRGICA